MNLSEIPISILELALVTKGSDYRETFDKTVALAQKADGLNYSRIWFAEHHNMAHVASSATSVLIGHIAGKTKNIRVGSGGIMLPNHSPLVVAEQFGTLEALYPHRIDLGLGRAPGTDQLTAQALNKDFYQAAQKFPQHVSQLLQYFSRSNSTSKVRAFPGENADIPIWILGSSMDSAILAAQMGLPYAFASHFAPTYLVKAFDYYRENFKPSPYLDQPKTMACVNMILAETNDEAEFQASSMYKMFLNIIRGTREPLSPPFDNLNSIWSKEEENYVRNMLSCSFVGDESTVEKNLLDFQKVVKMDELIIAIPQYDHVAKLKTIELARSLFS